MMLYELDEIEKKALTGKPRWIQYTVLINLKVPKFGPGYRRERYEFRFCAQSGADARSLASRNVPSRGFEKEVHIVEALPLFGEVKEMA